jgi:hypothetical protein
MAAAKERKVATPAGEIVIDRLDPAQWVTVPNTNGFRIYKFWEHPKTGASICLCDVPKGGTIPIRHRHASNQFMYCIEGTYEYLEPGLVLKPGTFYMNPKGNPHGPTIARTRCLLLEIYDGPHYFERPSFHTKDTVGRIAGKKAAKKKAVAKKAAGKKTARKTTPGRKTATKAAKSGARKAVKRRG